MVARERSDMHVLRVRSVMHARNVWWLASAQTCTGIMFGAQLGSKGLRALLPQHPPLGQSRLRRSPGGDQHGKSKGVAAKL